MLKFRDLVLNYYTNSEQATIVWLKGIGALNNSANCNKCGSVCNFVIKKGSYCWRSPKSGCQSVISMRDGSFFSGSHLKLNEIVEVSYLWACEDSVSMAVQQTGHSIVDWYNFHRDICAQWFLDHPVQIGGVGKVVEIDESKFGRKQYNRGRYRDGHWVFGGVERGTNNVFMVELPDRTAATLLPIIQQYILPGTTVIMMSGGHALPLHLWE